MSMKSLQELAVNELVPLAVQGGFHSPERLLGLEFKARGFSSKAVESCLLNDASFLLHLKSRLSLDSDQDVKEYIGFLLENSPSSYASLASSAMNFFYRKVLKPSSHAPMDSLPTLLSREEAESLLSAVSNIKHSLLLQLLYHCGLRVSEAVALRREDILLDEGKIHVKQAKGGDRKVPLPSRIIPKLEFYLRYLPEGPYLFPSGQGHIPTSTARRIVEQAAAQVGISKYVSPLTLRHSFALRLLEEGAGISRIRELLGHPTTLYAHFQHA